MIAGMSYYQICMFFLIYSFFGWVLEVSFHAVTLGKVINRGFLNGPVCPVYGFGVLAVFALGNSVQSTGTGDMNPGLLFLFGVLLATAVELTAGWLLDTLFHARWWDYSDKPFNFHGYICLEFSIIWGLAIVFVIKIVHPLIERKSTGTIPENIGWPIMGVLYAVYLADLIVTVAIVRGMNEKLKELDQIRASMRMVSDGLSEVIGENTIRTAQTIEESKVQGALARAELKEAVSDRKEEFRDAVADRKAEIKEAAAARKEEFRETVESRKTEMKEAVTERAAELRGAVAERKEAASEKKKEVLQTAARKKEVLQKRAEEICASLLRSRIFGARRLLKAFPDLKHHNYGESLAKLREMLLP